MSPQISPVRASSTKSRLAYLDSIRALAAIGVAYLHSALVLAPTAQGIERGILNFFTMTLDPGKIGVLVFFMVSGFIIPNSFRFNRRRKAAVRDFLLGRVFRLYPAYWLSILAAFFALYGGSLALCTPSRILLNITMFQQFFAPQAINIIGVYWTLQIEWVFYILCVALFLFGWLRRPGKLLGAYGVFMALGFAMAIIRYKTHHALPLAVPLGLSLMFASALWRMQVIERRTDVKRHVIFALGSLIAGVPIISLLGYNFNAGHAENWYRYTLCYWCAIGLFMAMTTKVKITWKPLVLVGRASFSLYLFNDIFHRWAVSILPSALARFSPNLYILVVILIACVLSLPVYEWLEKPMIALGKKLVNRIESPEGNATEATATQYV